MILPSSPSGVAGRGYSSEVRVSPRNRHCHSDEVPSSPSFVASFEWVRDDVLMYRSLITSSMGIGALCLQLELA